MRSGLSEALTSAVLDAEAGGGDGGWGVEGGRGGGCPAFNSGCC